MTEQPSLLPLSAATDLALLREARGLDLNTAAERLQCAPRVLSALEAGEPTGLAPVYLRGFLRRYAALLELDEGTTQTLLERAPAEASQVRSVFMTRSPAVNGDRWLRVASYALATLLVGTLAWQLAHEAVRLTRVDQVDATGTVTEPPAEERSSRGTGQTDPINASLGGLESLHRPSGSRTGDAGVRAWEALNDARAQQAALDAGVHLLELHTSADTWVEIEGAGDRRLEQDLVRGGEQRSYRGNGPFRISLGRASAVRLTLDGQEIALEPYTREDVARLLLDPAVLAAADPDTVAGDEP